MKNARATSLRQRVYVADSSIHGRGLFAARVLRPGQFIGMYRGPAVAEDGTHVLWIGNDETGWRGIDGRNPLRFLNHSAKPNAEMVEAFCFALREITAHEEITIDYGWTDGEHA